MGPFSTDDQVEAALEQVDKLVQLSPETEWLYTVFDPPGAHSIVVYVPTDKADDVRALQCFDTPS